MLTKNDLLKGTKLTKKVTIKELGGEIEIRPLNEEQWAEIDAKKVEMFEIEEMQPVMTKDKEGKEVYDAQKTRENIRLKSDLVKSKKIEFQVNILICKYGLIMDITEEELKQISPPGIIKKIAEEILKISKVSQEELEELESFRKE